MSKNMTMLILSCDKFSDLWEGHIQLLEKNWPNRNCRTIIVTDAPSNRTFSRIDIISAGEQMEWSERLAFALKQVETDYIFLTLDDYFLIHPVSNAQIIDLLDMMEKEKIDYVRLFPRPKSATKEELSPYKKIHKIDIAGNYSVNLYSGIWRKSFLESTFKAPKTAWQFEVSLRKRAEEYGASCVVSLRNEFQILDVVRKGKLLHKSARYFKTHPGIYKGNRGINTWRYEVKLGIQTLASRYLPNGIKTKVKSFMAKCGKRFYSDEVD